MPDLGKYAVEVMLAYGISLCLLALLVGISWAKARRVKSELTAREAQKDNG